MQLSTEDRRMLALNQAARKFSYDEETGFLYNSKTGKVYDTPDKHGQIVVYTRARPVTTQQVVWYMHTGLDPNESGARMCHMDGKPSNNKPENLRRLIGPMINRASYGNNDTSPYAGVSLHRKSGRYFAQYMDHHKLVRVPGMYDTPYEAKVARDEALQELIDERYGDFPTSIQEANK